MRNKWMALSLAFVLLLTLLQTAGLGTVAANTLLPTSGIETRNLALDSIAMGSGACNEREVAQFAVDGKTDTKWCDNSPRENRWLMLDLGEVFTINQYVVQNNCMAEGNQCPYWNTKNFRFQKSEDGKRWEDVDVIQNNSQTIVDRYVPAFDARYVRLYLTKAAHNGNTARISEFEVYGVERGQSPAYPLTNLTPVEYVDPFINTLGDNGQTNPGPRTPFGLVAPGPDSDGGAFSGYYYENQSLKGFSHLRFSGVGCNGAGGNILMMPTTKDFTTNSSVYKERYDKTSEGASAGYYTVELNSGIQVELTASDNVGFHRYTFPVDTETGSVLVDLSNSYAGMVNANLKVEGNEITGMIESRNVCANGFYKMYYSIQFDQDVASYTTWSGAESGSATERSGANSGVWLNFNFDNSADRIVQAKVGLSPISVEQARAEREQEQESFGWDFDKRHEATRQLWSDTLGKVEVTDTDEENKRIFYTQLYHAMQHPNNVTSSDGEFRAGRDENTIRHTSEIGENFEYYNGWSTWDDFRKYPLYSILEPQRFENMALSMIDLYKTRGSYTKWGAGYWPSPTVRNEFNGAVILDAIAKGLELSEPELREVLEGMAEDTDQYDTEDRVSGMLEKAYSAYYPMKLAEMVGDEDMYDKYKQLAMSYKQHWNATQEDGDGVERGFFTKNGEQVNPNDVKAVGRLVYQGNLWTYRWTVPHDVPGLAELMGGKRAMAEDLQHFFAIDEYVAVNEPDLHVPFLFNYLGMPYLTQYYAREYTTEVVTQKYHNHGLYNYPMKSRVYRADPEGYLLSMDDDAGAMSSWFVFSAMGLFPSNPGDPYYTIGSPIFSEVKLNLDNGRSFTIKANNVSSANRFIQSATLNGEVFDQPWINHADIMNGGALVFEMGAEPNYAWGASPEAAPPTTDYTGAVENKYASQELIEEKADWQFFDQGRHPGDGWTAIGFDDSDWAAGAAVLGYDNTGYVDTVVGYGPDGNNKYPTTYFRHAFQIDHPEDVAALAGRLIRDDGAIVYLNGHEIIRTNMPNGPVGYNTWANATVGNERNWLPYTIDKSLLVEGTNVIAAEVHQVNGTSSDVAFAFGLEALKLLEVPAAPTAPVIDDELNTFGWSYVPGFEQPELYEFTTDGGRSWRQVTNNPQTVGAGDYPAGKVQIRVRANPAAEQAAGLALISDQDYTANQLWEVYDLEVATTTRGQLAVTASGTLTGDYHEDPYVVFQLMDGGSQAWMTNAIPVDNGDFQVSQMFNVTGSRYAVNVYVVDAFHGNIYDSVWLAEPVAPRPEGQPGEEPQEPGLEPLPVPEKPVDPIDPFDPDAEEELPDFPDAPELPETPEEPGSDSLKIEFESFTSMTEATNPLNQNRPMYTEPNNGGTVVGNTFPGAWLAFEGVDFGEKGKNKVSIVYDAPTNRAPEDIALEFRLGGADGPLAGEVELPRTGDSWGSYITHDAVLDTTVTGVHDLYIVMKGSTTGTHPYISNLDSFTLDYLELRDDYAMLELEDYDEWSTALNAGNGRPMHLENGRSGRQVANTYDGAWLAYKNMNFGTSGVNHVEIEYAGNRGNTAADSRVEVRLGGIDGTLLATVEAPPTASGWTTYAIVDAELSQPVTGVHDLYLVLRGTTGGGISYIGNFDNARFTVKDQPETPVDPPVDPPVETEPPIRLEFEAAERSQENNTFRNSPMAEENGNGGRVVANTFTGAWFNFADVDFGTTAKNKVSLAYSGPSNRIPADVKAEIRLDGPGGTVIGEVAMPQTGSWSDFRVAEAVLTQPLSGTQTIYMVITGSTTSSLMYIGNLDYVSFAE
ncbi:GH92 family glycosyl hydrolase [Paenibacillus sp. 1P07SE]|uniref:GH92 family glycosyl hydrolase n=1 Tax=Paenibacillus sp. 1P07SE TaxID=3132209 RepID=UPI0039A5D297